jgi:hypothetical protein
VFVCVYNMRENTGKIYGDATKVVPVENSGNDVVSIAADHERSGRKDKPISMGL